MNMSLPQLSVLVHGWAATLSKDTRDYYYRPGSTDKQTIELDIKNVRDALDLLEQELKNTEIFVSDSIKIDLKPKEVPHD